MDNAVMTETKSRTIDDFCTHMLFECGEHDAKSGAIDFDYGEVNPHNLSREFIKFFELTHPLSLEKILTICNDSGFAVELLSNDHKARGYNFSYGENVKIFYKKDDSPSGQIHTLLHELYEVIDGKLYSYDAIGYERKRNAVEAKADQFSAYVHVPHETVFQWINSNGLDVFGLKDFLTCSYVTALIRMNEDLCGLVNARTGLPTSVIGILYERPYWKGTPSGRTPRLQLKFHVKSRGFPFTLSRNEIPDLLFHSKETGELTINRLINAYSKSGSDILLKNVELVFKTSGLTVDILIRTVNWRKYKHTAKILIQIMPSDQTGLRNLADRLNIKQYDLN